MAGAKGIVGGALENLRHRATKEKFERDQMRFAARIEAQRAKAAAPARDPVQRYDQLEKELLAEFRARAGGRRRPPKRRGARRGSPSSTPWRR